MARGVLTYKDYEALPADGRRYEIHDGELSATPAPGTNHQRFVKNLLGVLDNHVIIHGLGEVFVSPYDVVLSDTTIVQPDIVFVARAIEAYALGPGGYALAGRGAGDEPFALPPFPELRLVPAALWPPRRA